MLDILFYTNFKESYLHLSFEMSAFVSSALFNSATKIPTNTSDFSRIHLCCSLVHNLLQSLDTIRLLFLNNTVHFSPEPEVQWTEVRAACWPWLGSSPADQPTTKFLPSWKVPRKRRRPFRSWDVDKILWNWYKIKCPTFTFVFVPSFVHIRCSYWNYVEINLAKIAERPCR